MPVGTICHIETGKVEPVPGGLGRAPQGRPGLAGGRGRVLLDGAAGGCAALRGTMAWIESHQDLDDHPKTRKAAQLLGLSIPAMVGHLHILWHWALTYAQDGDLTDFSETDIALGARWDGDSHTFVCRAGRLPRRDAPQRISGAHR